MSVHEKTKVIKRKLRFKNSLKYLQEYSRMSTIHGVQEIFKEGESIYHRIIWMVIFLMCLGGAIYLILETWITYVKLPVEITVIDTLHSLNGELFPAITVCASNKIIYSRALNYLKRHLNKNKLIVNDSRINDFLSALVLFQHPVFYQMKRYLNESQTILNDLENINITDLMFVSTPKCEEIFNSCWWQGKKRRCCKTMFDLQRSEEGFCYSFNSLTSEKHKFCNLKDTSQNKSGCILKHNTLGASGPTSGVEIFIKVFDSLNLSPFALTGKSYLKIQAHHPHELPEAGEGVIFPIENLNKANMVIKVTKTDSTEEIRGLKVNIRKCVFRNEKKLNITKIYSQKSCIIECRLKFIIQKCQCLPYYFNTYDAGQALPICNSLKLQCVMKLNKNRIEGFNLHVTEDLRFYWPPNTNPEFNDKEKFSELNCTHCLPTCNQLNYEFTSELTRDFYTKNREFDGYADVYYKTSGAVKYKRDVTYNTMQLLVNLGGLGGLFLGGSLLSLMEISFWLLKAIISYLFPPSNNNLLLQKKKEVRNSVVHAWIN